MRGLCLTVLALLLTAAAFGQGWVGQGRVNRFDSDTDDQPCIALDSAGRPWVVWHGYSADTSRMYSRWLGDRWDEERGVGPDPPGVITTFKPCIAFDHRDRAWLVWDNFNEDNSDDIGSSFWADTCWTPEVQVNLPDSTELDFAPKVACGGGKVWCVWYGGPTDMSPYSVYASRWNDDLNRWELEMQVSPSDSTYHWWCDVAVDAQGTPHVVWCNSNRRLICYSYYDETGWVGPFPVNDTALVGATGWADPHIAIDNTGILHVSYTGVARGATGRDIFYTRNDGSGWTPSVRVTQDTAYNYNEWYSDIAADRPDNVWVVWDRQNEGPDQFRVYAAHFSGNQWSPEERLDNDTAYYDGCPAICLDADGNPWVVWGAFTYGVDHTDVYYNRYARVGLAERLEHRNVPLRLSVRMATVSDRQIKIEYELPKSSHVSLEIYDRAGRRVTTLAEEFISAGWHTARWNATASGGVFFCRLKADGLEEKQKVVLIGR